MLDHEEEKEEKSFRFDGGSHRKEQRSISGRNGSILYRHKKTGRNYVWLCTVFDKSDNNRGGKMILYMDLRGMRYVRRESEFRDRFEEVIEETT